MEQHVDFASAKKIPINFLELRTNNQPLLNEPLCILAARSNLKLFLNVYDTGESNKPTLVFIHGNSASMRVFHEQIRFFKDHYRIVALDLPGHGQSFKLEDMDLDQRVEHLLGEVLYSLSGMIAAANQALTQINVHKAHFICWSLGGHVAYGLANDNPDIAASITSIGSPPVRFSRKGLADGFKPWFLETLLPAWIEEPTRYPVEENLKIAEEFNMPEATAQYFAEDTTNADPSLRKYLFINLDDGDDPCYMMSEIDGHHFAKTTKLPLFLIAGDQDTGINSHYIASFKDQLNHPKSKVYIVKDGHHAPFATHADECHKLVHDFIQQIS